MLGVAQRRDRKASGTRFIPPGCRASKTPYNHLALQGSFWDHDGGRGTGGNMDHTIHEFLPHPARPTFAFLGGARLGGKLPSFISLSGKGCNFLCLDMLVTGRACTARSAHPHCIEFSHDKPFRG